MFTQGLYIGNQMVGCVVLGIGIRGTFSTTALIKQNNPVVGGIKKAPVGGATSGAGTAMQENHRMAVRISRLLPVNLVAVTNIKHTTAHGVQGRVKVGIFQFGVHGREYKAHCLDSQPGFG